MLLPGGLRAAVRVHLQERTADFRRRNPPYQSLKLAVAPRANLRVLPVYTLSAGQRAADATRAVERAAQKTFLVRQ